MGNGHLRFRPAAHPGRPRALDPLRAAPMVLFGFLALLTPEAGSYTPPPNLRVLARRGLS